MVAEFAAVSVVVVAMLAEWLHLRRVRRIGRLAFGSTGRPSAWTLLSIPARVFSIGLVCWGLLTLYLLDPMVHRQDQMREGDYKHLVLVLDVSPSMHLKDAGPDGDQSRRERASDVLESVFNRVPVRQFKISIIAVYSDAKPVLVDSTDVEVVRHILEKMPMYYVFKPTKTQLFSGLTQAAAIAKHWNPKSTTVVLLSDGDTVPAKGMPRMPASVAQVIVVGVGDSQRGMFIDGHQSRQDESTLRQIAHRLGGVYHNGNQKQLSSQTLTLLTQTSSKDSARRLTRREIALLLIAIGSAILAILPVLLHFFGTPYNPGVRGVGSEQPNVLAQKGLAQPAAGTTVSV